MPAVDDLLVASQAEPGRLNWPAGRSSAKGGTEALQAEAWLQWLSELLTGIRGLALVSINESGSATLLTQKPAVMKLPRVSLALARRAASRRSRQRLLLPATGELLLCLPLPTQRREERVSTVLLLFNGVSSEQRQQELLGLANWVVKSARWWSDRPHPAGSFFLGSEETLSEPLSIQQVIDRLAGHYPGTVCVLHWLRSNRKEFRRSRVMAVSGQSAIDHTGAAVRKMAKSVDAVYGKGPLLPVYKESSRPLKGEPERTDATAAQGVPRWTSSLMLPVQAGGELLLVSLHWSDKALLPKAEREQLQLTLVPAVQSAWLQQQSRQGISLLLWRGWRRWVAEQCQGGVKRCLQAGLLLAVLLVLLWPVEKRLSAKVIVEAAERHALIAPVDGYIKSVQARAGDRVAKGDLLARLDDKDLQHQADKWTTEAQKIQQDHLSALAAHDRVALSSLRESRVLIETELEQVKAQLARHELRSPVDGIVLSDAVDDALGSAVKAGDILFDVGSAEQYRLALQVPERRITEVQTGQLLSLRMAADPKQRSQARVDTLIPVATATQGQNTFKVYASALERDEQLRPGMIGIGKILVGRESRLMQWWSSLWTRCIWLAWKFGLVA